MTSDLLPKDIFVISNATSESTQESPTPSTTTESVAKRAARIRKQLLKAQRDRRHMLRKGRSDSHLNEVEASKDLTPQTRSISVGSGLNEAGESEAPAGHGRGRRRSHRGTITGLVSATSRTGKPKRRARSSSSRNSLV